MSSDCLQLRAAPKALVLLIISLMLISCAAQPLHQDLLNDKKHFLLEGGDLTLESSRYPQAVQAKLHYLGVGGVMLEMDGRRILTAPFYSNPPFLNNIPGIPLHRKTQRIDKLFPPSLYDVNSAPDLRIQAILAGHSHYDHLLDVPYLMQNYLQEAKLIGSETAVAIINNQLDLGCVPNGPRAQIARENRWLNVGNDIYVYTIPSTHAPHTGFLHYTAQTGKYHCVDPLRIRTAWDWKMGDVYAYLVDFRDPSGKILLRMYYQDSASSPSSGKIPASVLAEHPVDIAVVVLAGFSKVDDYPESVIANTEATLTVVGHWEDFFQKFGERPSVARGSDQLEFIGRLKAKINGEHYWAMTLPGKILNLNFVPPK